MNDPQRESEIERLLEGVADRAPRLEYRSRVRERFLAGAAAAPPVDVMPDERVRSTSGPRTSWKVWVALAAAACVVALLYLAKPAPRHWQVLPGSDATALRIDGERVSIRDGEALAAKLTDARSVTAEGGSVRLCYRDQYAIELPDAARVDFAAFGSTGGVDAYRLGVSGEALRVVTGPGFHGHELSLSSGAAVLHVTGTAFAIDTTPTGVCICGLAGKIGLLRKGTQDKDLPLEAGKQCFVPGDGGAFMWGRAEESHLAPVRALEAAAADHWRP
ncbi:MAG: hypothetical protein IPJ19_20030 [Planctomycetes bacterium]|nr:hypothetical protein [Planctomycetota bacterium]